MEFRHLVLFQHKLLFLIIFFIFLLFKNNLMNIKDILKGKSIEDLEKDLEKNKNLPNREFLLTVIKLHPEKLEKVKNAMKILNNLLRPLNMDEEIKSFFMPSYKTELTYFSQEKMSAMIYLLKIGGIDGSHFTIDIHENTYNSGKEKGNKFIVYKIKRRYEKKVYKI